MQTEETGVTIQKRSSFDDVLDVSFGRLEKKQAGIFLRRIAELEKTLSEVEESLVAMQKAHGEEMIS
jgi:hypothetical protein